MRKVRKAEADGEFYVKAYQELQYFPDCNTVYFHLLWRFRCVPFTRLITPGVHEDPEASTRSYKPLHCIKALYFLVDQPCHPFPS